MSTRRRIADTLERAPIIHEAMVRIYRLTQARFTMGVVGVVLNNKYELLVVEHVFHPHYRWGLPGGWSQRGEAPVDTLARELQEETGIQVAISTPLLIDHGKRNNHIDIAYLCYAQNDVSKLSSELLAYRWISPTTALLKSSFHVAAVQAMQALRGDS